MKRERDLNNYQPVAMCGFYLDSYTRKIIFKIIWGLGFSSKYYWMEEVSKGIEYVRLAIDLK